MADAFEDFLTIPDEKSGEYSRGPVAWAMTWKAARQPSYSASTVKAVFSSAFAKVRVVELSRRLGVTEPETIEVNNRRRLELLKKWAILHESDLSVRKCLWATLVLFDWDRDQPNLFFGRNRNQPNPITRLAISDFWKFHSPKRNLLVEPALSSDHEKILSDVSRNRDILATLMDNDWLGLKLLAQLKISKRAQALELAPKVLTTLDVSQLNKVVSVLLSLIQYGLVDLEGAHFVATAKGNQVVGRIEEKVGLVFSE
jgi:hypothetical protein